MKAMLICAAALFFPVQSFAGDIIIKDAIVPLAPPNAMTHAAFFTLSNTGTENRYLVGVSAEGYAMAHIHRTEEIDGIATMSALDNIALAPGQEVTFAHGGLHVMLMHPKTPLVEGATVVFSLLFAKGDTVPVTAKVQRIQHGS